MKPVHFLCQFFIGYIAGVSSVRACEQIPFEKCRRVLPYNATTYPNYLGHISAAQSVSRYSNSLDIYQSLGCHELLIFFMCTLLAPKCDVSTRMRIPPCRELCYSVHGPCMGIPDVECHQFPSMVENPYCISAKMAELTTTPPAPVVTTTIVSEPWTMDPTTNAWTVSKMPVQSTGQTSPGPTEVSKFSTSPTISHSPKMISPSSETSENTVTYKSPRGDVEVNNETIDREKSYESSSRIILGVSIGTLVTMVMLVTMCVCCRFYTQWKSPNARARPAPETYGGFYANPAFENTSGNDVFTQPLSNGPNHGGPIVNSSQTNTQIAAELAITQLPPHPASRPLHTLPVCAPGPHTTGTTMGLDQPPGPTKPTTLPPQTITLPANHQYPYQPSQRRNTLPANSSPASSRQSDIKKVPDTAKDIPLSLKSGTLPPEKVIENTGSRPYQEGGIPHYCTLNRNFTNSKNSPKLFNRSSFLWRRNSSKKSRKDDEPNTSSPKGTPSKYQNPAQDLVFANPAAKDEDCNKNGMMTEIDLNEDTPSSINQTKQEIDNRHRDTRMGDNKEKTVQNCRPVIANMSNNKQ